MLSEINFNIATENNSDINTLVSGNLWAIKGFISESATISNLLRSAKGSASDDSRAYVQCGSCHDPHCKNLTNPEIDFYQTYNNWDGSGSGNPVTSTTHLRLMGFSSGEWVEIQIPGFAEPVMPSKI